MTIHVIKRNGKREPLDLEKFHIVTQLACQGLTGVSASEVELNSQINFYDNIKTTDVQELLIKSAANLIDEDHPNYQYVAGRLINYHLRKEVYGDYIPLPIYDIVQKNINLKLYTPELLEWYSEKDFQTFDRIIDHNRDEDIVFAGMEQWRGKYLVKNRITNQIVETPQIALILIAAIMFRNYPNRMKWVKDYYDAISKFYISLATPIMAGMRTRQKQFSSCVLIDCDDSLDSITAAGTAIVKYVSQRAGIGINGARIRAEGDSVNNGLVAHTGVTPFYRYFQGATKSVSQGGVRSASATINVLGWHLEIESILVLKNNKGTEDNRVKNMDYVVHINKLFYERLIANENITLFSPATVPGLYDAFYSDYELFKTLYVKYEKDSTIRKKTIRAAEFFTTLIQERKDTGRIYVFHADNVNDHSPYFPDQAPVVMTNLCAEILQRTVPLKDINDPDGRISLCSLSAVNWGIINSKYEFEKYNTLAVRGLNELIDYQDYPVLAARKGIEDYRAIGIGVTNLAYWLAKNDLTYQNITQEGLDLIDEWMEAWSYYIIKASADMAEERGAPCGRNDTLRYSKGIIPFDTRKSGIDEIVKPILRMPWGELRAQLQETGVYNSPMMAQMPCESSSQPSNSTNGIEPATALIVIKQSKDGVLPQVVPEIRKYKNKYDLRWDQKSIKGYLKIVCVMQKWMDGGMSTNTSYNPAHYTDNKIPMSVIMEDMVDYYRWGGKNLYYFNTNDQAGEHKDTEPEQLVEVSQTIEEEYCESCVL